MDPASETDPDEPLETQIPSRIPVLLWLASLLLITIASPGATRMYAWPWSLAYIVAVAGPLAWLVLRSLSPRGTLVLPSLPWTALAAFTVLAVLGSALASPHRGPSLLWSAPLVAAVAVFLLLHDWLASDEEGDAGRRLLAAAGTVLSVCTLSSLAYWAWQALRERSLGDVLALRNVFPLGHPNHSAGLALLALGCCGALAATTRGLHRLNWIVGCGLALIVLVTSGSRGGLVGFVVLLAACAPGVLRALGRRWWVAVLAGLAMVAAVMFWNPRVLGMFQPAPAGAPPNISNVQRTAMIQVGLAMGLGRPVAGWGPGTTPLVYPRFRSLADGGAETVLQLHNTPIHLWAELGAAGVLAAAGLLLLTLRAAMGSAPQSRTAIARGALMAISGYAVFCLTDWQMDVPILAFAVAVAAAFAASAHPPAADRLARVATQGIPGYAALGILTVIAAWGRFDPTPGINTRALATALDPRQSVRAAGLLRESLQVNPHQEIAHFNLGWLLVVREPAAAESHFLAAAHLVPDKGGVYFGLGLSRLNQDRPRDAALAFAIEALNDPVFLVSPWWRTEPFAGLRREHRDLFLAAAAKAGDAFRGQDTWTAREARYNAALAEWILGAGESAALLPHAGTPERLAFLSRVPVELPAFDQSRINVYRRQRTGYPVLMRQPGISVPVDLFDVQENRLATGEMRFLFPAKGWLPSPLLLRLLNEP